MSESILRKAVAPHAAPVSEVMAQKMHKDIHNFRHV
jgi:hypothetical protein